MSSDNFTILICDDSILARKQLTDAISACTEGVSFLEASNGEECISLYKEHHPNLVFVDIVMPVLDGVGAVKGIIESDPNAVVIIVSSIGTRTELKNAIEAGAHDFIQKPFSEAQIREVISYYTKQ